MSAVDIIQQQRYAAFRALDAADVETVMRFLDRRQYEGAARVLDAALDRTFARLRKPVTSGKLCTHCNQAYDQVGRGDGCRDSYCPKHTLSDER